MRSHRLKPDLDDDDVTEVIYRVCILDEPLASVVLEMGINIEAVQYYVSQYEGVSP